MARKAKIEARIARLQWRQTTLAVHQRQKNIRPSAKFRVAIPEIRIAFPDATPPPTPEVRGLDRWFWMDSAHENAPAGVAWTRPHVSWRQNFPAVL